MKDIIYKILIDGLNLTDETLKKYGLSEEDITELINKKFIQLTEDKTYRIVKVDKFLRYVIRELLDNDKVRAKQCFRKCYELDPTNRDICLHKLNMAVEDGDYKTAFEVFENLEKINTDKYLNDNNLYLYLLSFITKCPKNYIDRVKSIKGEDYMLPRSHCNIKDNKARKLIQDDKFPHACNIINEYSKNLHAYSIKFELLKILLVKTILHQKKLKRDILIYAKEKKYVSIASYLEDISQCRQLTKYEKRILKITNEILKVKYKKNISPIINTNATNLDEALNNNNFILALELNKVFLSDKEIDSNNDTINLLLLDLNQLINEFKNPTYNYSETTSSPIQTVDKDIIDAENYVDLILNEGITLEEAIKKYGIIDIETILLIKLAYVKRCYESNDKAKLQEANYILQEVEIYENKSEKVMNFLNQIKAYGNRPYQRTHC